MNLKTVAKRGAQFVLVLFVLLLAFTITNSVVNAVKMDYGYLGRHFDRMLSHAESLAERSVANQQVRVLNGISTESINGDFFLFDQMLSSSEFNEKPLEKTASAEHPYLLSYEFLSPQNPGMKPVSGSYQISNGTLTFNYSKVNFQHEGGLIPGTYDGTRVLESIEPIELKRSDVGELELRLKLEKASRLVFAWSGVQSGGPSKADIDVPNNRGQSFYTLSVIPDGRFHTYRMNMETVIKGIDLPSEPIRKIYLYPVDVDEDMVEIDYVRFVSKRAKFSRKISGAAYQRINKEYRKVIYTQTPARLDFDLTVPGNNPRFKFGLGILDEGDPVDFSVEIEMDGFSNRVFSMRVTDSTKWDDVNIDLSEYAEKRVKISLITGGGQKAIGFWSNPVLFSSPRKKFNIVMVMEDALRADHMSAYGYHRKTTPVKDGWAKKGVLFLNAYAQATFTKASCASLMTSLYPSATGVLNYIDMLHENYLTMAEVLRNHGFATGSFTQNNFSATDGGMHQGFDNLIDWETIGNLSNNIYNGPKVMEWIDKHSDRNFFLFLHLIDPHAPYSPPEEALQGNKKPFLGGKYQVPKNPKYDPEWIETPTVGSRNFLYDQEIRYNDFFFDHFLRNLEERELLNDTLIIFLSDHGERLGEQASFGHGPPGFRHVLHVPLIMVYPSKLPQDTRVEQPVQLLDVFPTIMEMAGVEIAQLPIQGDSLLSLIEKERLAYWDSRFAFTEEVRAKSRRTNHAYGSIFGPRWQIMNSRYQIDAWAKRAESYHPSLSNRWFTLRAYNLQKDPYGLGISWPTLMDPYFSHKIKSFMKRFYLANQAIWENTTQADEETMVFDAQSVERLRSLGYVK